MKVCLTDIAVWANVSCGAGAGASAGLTHSVIQTLALLLAVGTIMAHLTL